MRSSAGGKAAGRHWDEVHLRASAAGRDPDQSCARALAHFGPVAGKTLLEIGCGAGHETVFWAGQGATVTAVDSSSAAIEATGARLRDAGCTDVELVAIDALDIAQLGRFDLVYGSMILHHLEPFGAFARALSDTLEPGGRGFFSENSAASRSLVWCREHLAGRMGIPKYGDDDEFPLTPQEIDRLRDHLDVDVRHPEFAFVSMLSTYLFRGRLRGPTAAIDRGLSRVAFLRQYSYRQDVLVTKPVDALPVT